MKTATTRFSTAEGRWSGIGPYYAMFPISFAENVIRNHTDVGDIVLDPFSGRGTAVFGAAELNRCGIGVEINPVGWLYTKVKLAPADEDDVTNRLEEISKFSYQYRPAAKKLPAFFHRCYTEDVRAFLLCARRRLNWRQSKTDRTLMALLLVHLHGKRTDSFSNQMRQTKSMSPPYAIRWWKENGHKPPAVDPLDFMKRKIRWRYAKGTPEGSTGYVYLGDSAIHLPQLESRVAELETSRVQLLLTSPPYCGITNYHYDQWLRLWMLGEPEYPSAPKHPMRGKFVHRQKYRELLKKIFQASSELLDDDAVVYVRTDSRKLTRDISCEVLAEVFPHGRLRRYKRPFPATTQTHLFGDKAAKDGEVDIVVHLGRL